MAQFYRPGQGPQQRKRKAKPKPATIAAADVVGLDHFGRGVVRSAQGVKFVAGALPGEVIDYVESSKYEAELLAVQQSSPERQQPACEFYRQCGGCDLQHLNVAAQQQHKQQVVTELLHKFAGIDVTAQASLWQPTLSGSPWNYRRRARLAAHYDKSKRQLTLGFRARKSKTIVPISECATLALALNNLLAPLRACLAELKLVPFLGHVELLETTAEPLVVLRLTRSLAAADRARLVAFSEHYKVRIAWQDEQQVHLLDTGPLPQYATWQAKLQFNPGDFLQTHRDLAEAMVAQALQWLEPESGDTILELFAGSGHFTIPFARSGAQVTAIEGVPSMVRQLQHNAHLHGVAVTAACSNLAQPWAQSAAAKLLQGPFNKVLLDPARAGAAQAVQELVRMQPAQILYISCAPDTLARDAATLVQGGYHLKQAQLVDMFPQTHHIEVMTLFERE